MKKSTSNSSFTIVTRDKAHRISSINDEPAIIYKNGTLVWYKKGKIHREKGPAVIYANGDTEYFLSGVRFQFDDWIKLTPISEEDKLALLLER